LRFIKFLFVLILSISFNPLFSQVKFSAGPTLGYTAPTGDYSGTTIDYYAGTRYGLSGGINFGAIFKAKFSSISGKVSVIYSSLSNTGNSEPGQGTVEVRHNLLTIGLGPEFSFSLTGSQIKPYVGADLLFTSISGETTFLGVSRVPSGTFSMSSSTRTGLGFGAGVLLGLGKNYSLDIGFRYNLHNLMGKSFTPYGENDSRLFAYTSLNDDRDPIYPDEINDHPIGNSRSISSIMINLAFLFDF
jgi:outer membrane autotransporter protein